MIKNLFYNYFSFSGKKIQIINRMTITILFTTLLVIFLSSCNKNAKRYNAKTINPELIGTWISTDKCTLTLKKENDTLILTDYNNNKGLQINNIPLTFKLYSIATELKNKNAADPEFNAKYIDGAIIMNSNDCQPLQKVQ